MRIGFIGAGKVGVTFAKYLQSKGQNVLGFFSAKQDETQEATDFTQTKEYGSISELVSDCDMVFITTTDNAIADVWNEMRHLPIKGKYICHCSGATTTDVFCGIEDLGAFGYAIHPLCMVSDKFETYKMFHKVAFTVEGSHVHMEEILEWMRSFGNPIESIKKESKPLYHAAGVALSSLLLAVTKMGVDAYLRCGLNKEFVDQMWPTLLLNSAKNIHDLGLEDGLSGPLERGDSKTIKAHMNAMTPQENEIYVRLSRILLGIAKNKNPQRDYSAVEELLKS
jgi:predicted short-subunit dehydrogenase-like oxidoreductase (DUF2520 family)